MAITAERLEVDVTADTSSARRELDSFQSRTDAAARSTTRAGGAAGVMGGKFKMAAGLVKAAAGTMVAAVAGQTIMAASDLNEQLSKTGVVFGPQASIVTDAAQQMADKFGVSKTVFLEAASGIGLVGKASGLTAKAAANLGTDMGKLAADASSFYNVPVEEALAAMKSGLVGEAEPMRQFGVLLSEAAVQAEAVRLGVAKAGEELTEGQKVQARASLITKGMADANGDLARTQDSVANRLKEIRGRLTNFAADMGMKALPAAEKFLAAVIKAPKVIGGAAKAVADWATNSATVRPVLDLVVAAVKGLVDGVGAIPGIFATVNGAVQEFIDKHSWIKPVLDSAAVAIGAFVAAFLGVMAIQKVLAVFAAIRAAIIGINMAMMANPVGLVIAALVALAAVAYAAYQRFEPFRNLVDSVASTLRNALGTALDWVKAKWQEWGPTIMAVLSGLWTGVKTYLGLLIAYWRTVFTAVSAVVKVAFNLIASYVKFMLPIWKAGFQAMVGVARAVWNTIKGVIRGAIQVVKGIINVVMGVIKGDWGRAWQGIKQIVTGVWGVIKSLVSGAIGVVKAVITGGLGVLKAAWSSAWNAMKSLLSTVWNGIKSGVQNGISAVMGFVQSLPGKITGVFSNAGSLLLGAGKAIIQGLLDGIGSMIGSLQDKLGGITDMIPDLKGPYEKDLKLLRKNGRAIIKGLIKGFDQEIPALRKYLKKLTEWVRDGFGGKTEKRLVQRIKSAGERARRLIKRDAALTERLKDQLAKKADLQEKKREFIDSMRQGISQQANVLNAGNNAGTIRASLEAQVAKAREFAKNLKAMAGMGYPKELIAQVAGAGIEGGAEVAKALVAANSADAAGIASAFTEINQIAASQSKALGNMLYNPGIQAAQGLIDGLKKKRKGIEEVLVQIAKGMQKALKKALGIKSPSRVMARLAAFVGAGLVRGLDASRRNVGRAATRMGSVVTNGVTSGLGSGPGPFGPPGGPGGLTPASLGVGSGSGDTHFHFTTNNPVAEPQSRTTNKALDRVTSLGLV